MRSRILLITLCLLIPLTSAFGQEAVPDRWRGLVLNEASPEDAIKTLGSPRKDALTPLSADPINQWITKKRKQKIFRTLEYKNPTEGVEKAWLSFLDDKLVSVMLDMKEGTVSPNGLSAIYGIEFQPVVNQLDLSLSPRDFERNQGKIYPSKAVA